MFDNVSFLLFEIKSARQDLPDQHRLPESPKLPKIEEQARALAWRVAVRPIVVESQALYRNAKPMHLVILATFLEISSTAVAMCVAGSAIILIGLWAAKNDIAQARGLDKIVALANLCFAAPLAVFGALHLFGPAFVKDLVPRYMPGRMFWVYFVGCALIAASLSIATKIGVRWSGLLVGVMMFMFVAMLYLPGGLRQMHA
ncbi:MAG TPA: hypothetical protein VLA83_11670, partial [Candidatus Binatia bacterium]|nr:hypothetical protein [Candidatus Binatia bacterium]